MNGKPDIRVGEWVSVHPHQTIGKVIEKSCLWGSTTFRVWLPSTDSIVRVNSSQLSSTQSSVLSPHHLSYVAAAARITEALAQGALLAPLEASVIPLPHQIYALSKAISGGRVRYLLADEVGLGKTVEAGLIMRELKLRGLVRRTLVVAPKGLVTQWVAEMRQHFNEEFRLVLPEDLSSLRRVSGSDPWRHITQAVVPMDSFKPLEKRRGWTVAHVAAYNRGRFEDLISAGWDLVIVDEAHRLGGSTDQVARFRLGQGLAGAAPYLLLLTATPHQGKSDSFCRLLSLLEASAFPDQSSIRRERVRPYVIRTEKRRAVDAQGQPLFRPRQTRLVAVSQGDRHRDQRLLYEAVTEYVRQGYNQALKERKNYIGFLMILMQRLVTSSTRAIRTAVERRLEVLSAPAEQLALFPDLTPEEWADLDAQEQMELLFGSRLQAVKNERAEVKKLLEMARRTEAAGPDAKAEALLDWIYRLQQEEADPDLRVLVFTEFVPTQEMLRDFFRERGFPVVCLNGSMGLEERRKVQEAFAGEARMLISTDAGGEGLNLQFCHVVVNYDIPWNPMRLEQRIGRVDRIGQRHTVRALNFVLEDTVEHRVQEVLEEKLAVILREFGADKTADVLDSAEAEKIFDELYLGALLRPEELEGEAASLLSLVREQARTARENASLISEDEVLDPGQVQRLVDHPALYWVETMTTAYLKSHGGRAERSGRVWNLNWPDGEEQRGVVFTPRDAEAVPQARQLGLKDPRILDLIRQIAPFVPGQPLPVLLLPDLPGGVAGFWSLWKIALQSAELDWNRVRVMPLFLHDDGRVLVPTARYIWDQLLSGGTSKVCGRVEGGEAMQVHERVRKAAEKQGRSVYEELLRAHQERLAREKAKGEYTFAARRRTIERIGLSAVRAHRFAELEREEREWRQQFDAKAGVIPDMIPLLMIRIEGR